MGRGQRPIWTCSTRVHAVPNRPNRLGAVGSAAGGGRRLRRPVGPWVGVNTTRGRKPHPPMTSEHPTPEHHPTGASHHTNTSHVPGVAALTGLRARLGHWAVRLGDTHPVPVTVWRV